MSWVRSDDHEATHTKMLNVSVGAFGYHQAAKQWASRNLTNGFIPVSAIGPAIYHSVTREQALQFIAELTAANDPSRPGSAPLWEIREEGMAGWQGDSRSMAEGWQIHDYLDYNRSRKEVLSDRIAQRAAKVTAGKAGARARWHDRLRTNKSASAQGNIDPAPDGGLDGRAIAEQRQEDGRAIAEAWQKDGPLPPSTRSTSSTTTTTSERSSRRPAATKVVPGVRQVFDAYHAEFLARHGVKPAINGGKDGATVKRLIGSHGLDKILEMLPLFFASIDPFIVQSGHTLGVFGACFNKLLTGGGGTNGLPSRRAVNDPWKDKTVSREVTL